MEKQKGAVKMRDLGICIREDEVRRFSAKVAGETVLEVGTFNTQAEFTTSRPNGHVGPMAKTRILVGSAFQTTVEFNPTSTTALMVQPSVLEVYLWV
jgi:hypothetical protein